MIAIVDYGAGNIKSLQFALKKLNMHSCVTTDATQIRNSDAIILPGVGAFKDAINELQQSGLATTLKEEVSNGKKLLGICLGMQLFYENSYEDGVWEGLGLLKGNVKKMNDTVKVPHMGWNTLTKHRNSPLLKDTVEEEYVYFVHSYAVQDYQQNTLVSSTNYGGIVPAIVQQDNVIGMQFHPEKSGEAGLQLLRNFKELIG
ncbi:imidazole glycerol phosphate synthase subunit HisH [Virgibacillus halodenitrificans]|uniref:imidazole glycerol phosphate synthase subunit HisH n=1 Tax=Virgibacillus halodenitrificans TaxID=1482 RepID=UPI0002E6955D|nr:imidazole glycerol phosphate synthase subunit HisH [Virgibacillus halodenitrificans]MCG1027369.1 imidazole glycerol phosphate synthase subunit HisH [Virgibacillus halodenitrificans]MEC2159129.1 imidazole glycerol phosphate synthase subunit HisH [Virgibacillus halodenitrificans]MYL46851.1 imidazole glycerol phosphate synthase subunit HisH [Virgibacillus halodenitrificans]MYL58875.1 imidazole glycerol phosphate synthase subunit HisH [Virgibacillus halodenitrificans]